MTYHRGTYLICGLQMGIVIGKHDAKRVSHTLENTYQWIKQMIGY
jgi:hypothetical protein